jgi:hypothetical protein
MTHRAIARADFDRMFPKWRQVNTIFLVRPDFRQTRTGAVCRCYPDMDLVHMLHLATQAGVTMAPYAGRVDRRLGTQTVTASELHAANSCVDLNWDPW